MRKGDDVQHVLKVSLEDLYKGKKSKLALNKKIICPTCKGGGAKEGAKGEATCSGCRGRGVRLITRQVGPGMIQQMQAACDQCGGRGSTIRQEDKCGTCSGAKVVPHRQVLEVFIDKGSRHKQKVMFRGEADQSPGVEPGDIIIILAQKEHKIVRKGDDLICEQKISLRDALCGCSFVFKHLDGREIVISTPRVIKPGQIMCVSNEGMPLKSNPTVFGNLVFRFEINFPTELGEEAKEQLLALLPSDPAPEVGERETALLSDISVESIGVSSDTGGSAYDEDDDEDGPGGQRVQCANQ